MSTIELRDARIEDLPAISEIYNYYVLNSTCTYQLEPETLADRQNWFALHSPQQYPVLVAEAEDRVIGWGSLSKFHQRSGYNPTVEASVYIDRDHHRRGLGRTLLQELIERARQIGYHSVIGGASADQTASVVLQQSLGFVQVGLLKEVGFKFGRRLDVMYLQLIL